MRSLAALGGAVFIVLLAGPVAAQQPSNDDLMRRIDALEREVAALKAHQAPAPKASSGRRAAAAPVGGAEPSLRPPTSEAVIPVPNGASAVAAATAAGAAAPQPASLQLGGTIPGLDPPEPMGNNYEGEGNDALLSAGPGLAIALPALQTEFTPYGFAKLTAWGDFNARNQTDAPPVQTIPLTGGPGSRQGGDFGATARFSRIGFDSRTVTDWGTLETRLEGDFGGGSPASSNAVFRLRQAWGELGTPTFRVLAGQTNSLWNEGVFETLIDATNLNQSFIRQAQLRATGRLAPGLTGMASLEAPEMQFTSANGVFVAGNGFNGGASPAFNTAPDLLGRLTYNEDGLLLDLRGAVRYLSLRTAGTALAPPSETRDATGWGFAGLARFPMRRLSDAFGPDTVSVMAYYGDGMGRYFAGNTSGQDALSNLGLPGVTTNVSLNTIPTYGITGAYRRFWTTALRSNVAYAYARQDFPSYASEFVPGSASATSLNRDMQQVFVNLIWSPFATLRDGTVTNGWLDVGIEYLYSRRDVFGGSEATGSAGVGHGVANRLLGAAVARF